jgi:hypothetical protein
MGRDIFFEDRRTGRTLFTVSLGSGDAWPCYWLPLIAASWIRLCREWFMLDDMIETMREHQEERDDKSYSSSSEQEEAEATEDDDENDVASARVANKKRKRRPHKCRLTRYQTELKSLQHRQRMLARHMRTLEDLTERDSEPNIKSKASDGMAVAAATAAAGATTKKPAPRESMIPSEKTLKRIEADDDVQATLDLLDMGVLTELIRQHTQGPHEISHTMIVGLKRWMDSAMPYLPRKPNDFEDYFHAKRPTWNVKDEYLFADERTSELYMCFTEASKNPYIQAKVY